MRNNLIFNIFVLGIVFFVFVGIVGFSEPTIDWDSCIISPGGTHTIDCENAVINTIPPLSYSEDNVCNEAKHWKFTINDQRTCNVIITINDIYFDVEHVANYDIYATDDGTCPEGTEADEYFSNNDGNVADSITINGVTDTTLVVLVKEEGQHGSYDFHMSAECTINPVCGDNVVEGAEECDPPGSHQNRTCGSDMGICKTGIENRTCGDECMWGGWSGECFDDVKPGIELCTDYLDNDCDGLTDCLDIENCSEHESCEDFDGNGGDTVCGNDIKETGETCDGLDLDEETCKSLGFGKGVLDCESDCSEFIITGCIYCGDGKLTGSEECDGEDLNEETCKSQEYDGGTLSCTECKFDFTECTLLSCGDNKLQGREKCDGEELNDETCKSLDFYSGTLACSENCNFDTSDCVDKDDDKEPKDKDDKSPPEITDHKEVIEGNIASIDVTTDEVCNCKYSKDKEDYTEMKKTDSKDHEQDLFIEEGTNTFYILCEDEAGNEMEEALKIKIGDTPVDPEDNPLMNPINWAIGLTVGVVGIGIAAGIKVFLSRSLAKTATKVVKKAATKTATKVVKKAVTKKATKVVKKPTPKTQKKK